RRRPARRGPAPRPAARSRDRRRPAAGTASALLRRHRRLLAPAGHRSTRGTDSTQRRVWWSLPLTRSSSSIVTWKWVSVAWIVTSELPSATELGRVIRLVCRPCALAEAGSSGSQSATNEYSRRTTVVSLIR